MDDIAYERRRFRTGYNARGTRQPENVLDDWWHRSRTGAARYERTMSFQDFDWMAEALCKDEDPELFFPRQGPGAKRAARVCAECPVMVQCGEYAEATDSLGVWGGKNRVRCQR